MADRAAAYEKLEKLKTYLNELGSVAVAFSGGVDSTFLLKVAHDTLGDKAIAISASSGSIAKRELREAVSFCNAEGIKHEIITLDEMKIEGFRQNPPDRCYMCKKAIFTNIISTAAAFGIQYVAEGSNMDDNSDYRPGHRAIMELNVKSPLREAGLYKEEIRILSRKMDLPTWNKPSFACLASRFPYGEEITPEKLLMVEKAEEFLLAKGYAQMRVRIHGDIARLEILPEDFEKMMAERELIHDTIRSFGFSYVALDLKGFRSGSMNETLTK